MEQKLPSPSGHRHLSVNTLTRVEGEGALDLVVKDGVVTDVSLRIYEPPRFFEAFLQGRSYEEVPDLVARICGICPVAYQMSAVHALEDAFGAALPPHLRRLRRLFYCGEWMQSHALHVFLLHAPDFLGYENGVALARDHPEIVRRGLRLKKIGNTLLEALGGRAVHPISPCVGGFHGLPSPQALAALAPDLAWGVEAAAQTVQWAASLTFPDFEQDYEMVALSGPGEYPMNEGDIVSSTGLRVANGAWEDVFEEFQEPHSTALHARRKGGDAYLVGPMARLYHNHQHLSPAAGAAMRQAGYDPAQRNPFRSIIARCIELTHVFEEALGLINTGLDLHPPRVAVTPRAATGRATTEAPRGILYHRYEVGGDGLLAKAVITPPTSQNQRRIEQDLKALAQQHLHLDDAALTRLCEFAIRNHDPCISCSAHFLKLSRASGGTISRHHPL